MNVATIIREDVYMTRWLSIEMGLQNEGSKAGDCIIAENEAPCVVCGKPTKLIEYCFECRLCSEECIHRFVKMCFPRGDTNSDLKRQECVNEN